MPLFECTKCHVIDNTALGNFWVDRYVGKKSVLCAQCDPEIGKWHGQFPRTLAKDYDGKVEFPARDKSNE